MTDWWSRWSRRATWSRLPLEEQSKSAHVEPSGGVEACSGGTTHPVSRQHGSHARLLIEARIHVGHQVPLTERT